MEVAINKRRYSWADIRATIFGRTLEGITGIEYSDSEEINPTYGRGKRPVGYTQNNYEANGTITLLIDEIIGIQNLVPRGRGIQDIPTFDIVVSYMDETGNIITDKLKGCKFRSNGRTGTAGETGALEQELELFILEIQYNV
jgi:hypothetical protein